MKKIRFFIFIVLLLILVPFSLAGVSGDVDGDGQVGVSEAINALQVSTGLRASTATTVNSWKIIKAVGVDNEPLDETDEVVCFIYSNGIISSISEYEKNRTTGNIWGEERYNFITDANGCIRYKMEHDDGRLNIERFEYDADGKLIGSYEDENFDGTIDEYQVFSYNVDGKITRSDEYDGSDNFVGYTLVLYNEEGLLEKYEWYSPDDQLLEYGFYAFDTEGRSIVETNYDADGNLMDTFTFTREKIESPANGLNSFLHQLIIW